MWQPTTCARVPTLLQALALLPVAFAWSTLAWRVAASYGAAALLVSPAVAWLPLLVLLWLHLGSERPCKPNQRPH